jgi:hypothetical protein
MSDDPTRNQAIRDAVAEAGTTRSEKAVGVPSTGGEVADLSRSAVHQDVHAALNAELAKARRDPPVSNPTAGDLIRNGPGAGPLIRTDPLLPPAAHAVGIAAVKAYGELAGDGVCGMAARAGGSAWEAAVTAEPGTRMRTVVTHLGFDLATDELADPNGDHGQVRDRLDGIVNRHWPARPRTDDNGQPPLIR